MSYLVLARKWRPKTFDDVIGQEYLTQTLKNAVSTGKIAHAMIFSGPRGVGKTSTARIVAKAMNCEKGPTPEPCSSCSFCREIAEGRSLDVIEIDAASHTGVGDIREIIENTKYLPSSGKTKVYIIDEAHMLSQSAFNALLKTLEEPPPRVLFILATTEAHKIPVTILSRCQRYDLKKIPTEKIKERLDLVTSSEGIKIAEETLYLLSQEADGSLRDSLSLLDQLVATFGSEIKHEEAASALGILDRPLLKSALLAVLGKDPKACIETLHKAMEKGVSPKRFAEDLLKLIRNALIIKACGKEIASDLSLEEKNELEAASKDESVLTLESLFNLMLSSVEDVQRSSYPAMALEAALVRVSLAERAMPLEDILGKIEALQKKIGTGGTYGNPHVTQKKEIKEPAHSDDYSSKPAADEVSIKRDEVNEESSLKPSIEGFLNFVKLKKPMTGMHLAEASGIRIEDSVLIIEFETSSIHSDYLYKEAQENLKKLSKDFFSEDLRVKVDVKSGIETGYTTKERSAKSREEIQKEPVVQDALEIFGGRIVGTRTKEKE